MDQLIVDATKAKDKLISEMNTVILSTVSKDQSPNSSYAPAFVDDNNNFYVYISSLSKHTRNLLENPIVSIMIIEDESECENIFGRKRFTMDANSEEIRRDSDEWISIIDSMEEKFGDTIKYLKDMTDFYLFKFKPHKGLLVHGFARAFRFYGEKLEKIDYMNDKGHTAKK